MAEPDRSGRVVIQQAIGRAADEATSEYGLLTDGERLARLQEATDGVVVDGMTYGAEAQADALIQLAAEAQLWAEALQAGAAR